MKYRRLSLLIVPMICSVAHVVSAEQDVSPFYLKAGVGASVSSGNNKEMHEGAGFEGLVGLQLDNGIFIEGGYQNLSLLDDERFDALSARVNWKKSLSNYASLYAGSGFSLFNGEVSPSAQLGVQYSLSSNWVADASYQGLWSVNSAHDDLYSFNLAFIYHFSRPAIETDYSAGNSVVSVVEEPVPFPVTEPICQRELRAYTLVDGDWLNYIARSNYITLEQLLSVNPQLNNRNLDLVYPGEKIFVPYEYCE